MCKIIIDNPRFNKYDVKVLIFAIYWSGTIFPLENKTMHGRAYIHSGDPA